MSYRASAVANFFITRGVQDKSPVDPMKLQKLVYFGHGWYMAVTGEPLVNEHIEAWRYGPVTPSLYHEVKANGSGPIDFPIFETGDLGSEAPRVTDPGALEVLERVWQVYGEVSSVRLSGMSHDPDGPWHSTWQNKAQNGALRGADIPNDEIRRYFGRLARRG